MGCPLLDRVGNSVIVKLTEFLSVRDKMAVLPLAQFSSNPRLGSFSGMVRVEDSTEERGVLALAHCRSRATACDASELGAVAESALIPRILN